MFLKKYVLYKVDFNVAKYNNERRKIPNLTYVLNITCTL